MVKFLGAFHCGHSYWSEVWCQLIYFHYGQIKLLTKKAPVSGGQLGRLVKIPLGISTLFLHCDVDTFFAAFITPEGIQINGVILLNDFAGMNVIIHSIGDYIV